MPQVSVIVPARDVGEYIAPLLGDLQNQAFTDLEVIVVDDGSTDTTPQAVEQFVDRDKRFRLFTSGGEGVSTARNVGIDNSTGEFLAFVDADDRVAKDYLSKLHETISATGSDLVSCNALRLEGFQTSPSILHQRACARPARETHLSRAPQLVWDTTVWNKLWRREMWDRAGLRYAEGRWLNDFYPCMRGHVSARKVDVLGETLYYWRIRTDPTTSITDSRLTSPVARIKSFDDRMFAMRSARRMLADELPVPAVLDTFDHRLLRSDLPIYLPYYVGSDSEYQELIVAHVGELLTEFRIDPTRYPLGMLLQRVYQAIQAGDHEQLGKLLDPATVVAPSAAPPQHTELRVAGDGTAPDSTPHGRFTRRWARLVRKLPPRRAVPPPLEAAVHLDRVDRDPASPATIMLHGVARVKAGRSSVAGDWTVAAVLSSTRKDARVARIARVFPRGRRVLQWIQRPPARVAGAAVPLAAPPDQTLHPLVRSGWRPFTARIDLAELRNRASDPEWSLGFELRSGGILVSTFAKLGREAGLYLPGGYHVGGDVDLFPVVSKSGRLTLRRELVRCQVVGATPGDGNATLRLRPPAQPDHPAAARPRLWLQTPDRQVRLPEIVAGTAVELAVPEFPDDAPHRYELWCETSRGAGRVRAHPRLRTTRLALAGSSEVVLRPTAQGRVILERRPRQLDLTWLHAGDVPGFVATGGPGRPRDVSRSRLTLVLSCPWSEDRLEVPIEPHPDGWQAAIDIDQLVRDAPPVNRAWSLHARTTGGAEPQLRVPSELRELLPFQESTNEHPVQVRMGQHAGPVLWIGDDQSHHRWRQFRKVQRSVPGPEAAAQNGADAVAPAPEPALAAPDDPAADGAAADGAARPTGSELAPETILRRLTAPQRSRSMTKVGAPSFREKVDQRVRRRRYLQRFTDTLPVTEPLLHKPQRDQILSMLGFPVPAKLLDQGTLAEVFDTLAQHDEAVVKPVSGAVGKGVCLLRRVGTGWLDLRTETTLSTDQLKDKLSSMMVRRRLVTAWQVEQLVVGDTNASGHPMDYKLYMFQGRHGLTVQVKWLPDRLLYKFYDPAWRAIEVGRDEEKVDPTLPPPQDPGPLVDLAARVSQALPLPFIRIDLLVGRDGVYVGEVTPMPGRYHRFNDELDHQLGLYWELAELEHGLDFLTSERFQPALTALRKVSGAERFYPV